MCGCEHHWESNAPCTCRCPEHAGIRREMKARGIGGRHRHSGPASTDGPLYAGRHLTADLADGEGEG